MQGSWKSVTAGERSADDADTGRPFGHLAPNTAQRGPITLSRAAVLKRDVFRDPLTRAILSLDAGELALWFRGTAFRARGKSMLTEFGLLLVPNYDGKDCDFLKQAAPPETVFVDLGRGDLPNRKVDVANVAIAESADADRPLRRSASLLAELGARAIRSLRIDVMGHDDRTLARFLDPCLAGQLPRHIVIEHPESQIDYPGYIAAFVRYAYRLIGRARHNSMNVHG